ncbi:hypothetical protein [Bradyrhizobium sp.]|uniref:hypothetical protein n=1 Tax=Bradyrhizobium sp. TaxID=376 RepID=UPI0039E5C99B
MTQLTFPETITPEIDEILGMPNFRTTPIAHLFRESGEDIPPKMEREQAFILFWLLRLALEHGADWKQHAGAEIERRLDIVKAQRQNASETKPNSTLVEVRHDDGHRVPIHIDGDRVTAIGEDEGR